MLRRAGHGVEHGGAGARRHRRAGHGVAAVIVDDVEDLDRGAVGEDPTEVVQRPALVGSLSGVAAPAVPGGLVRRCDDHPAGGEDPPDRRLRRQPRQITQVERDRPCAAVQAGAIELLALGHDRVLDIG